MNKVTAINIGEVYKTNISTETGHHFIVDEPIEEGGQNLGVNPYELLCSALASCTTITLKMYITRKQWNVENITVECYLEKDEINQSTNIYRTIKIQGLLDEQQRKRLEQIANACPIHKILTQNINIQTLLS
jgi:putative redox protein